MNGASHREVALRTTKKSHCHVLSCCRDVAREALDAPGEWLFDAARGTLLVAAAAARPRRRRLRSRLSARRTLFSPSREEDDDERGDANSVLAAAWPPIGVDVVLPTATAAVAIVGGAGRAPRATVGDGDDDDRDDDRRRGGLTAADRPPQSAWRRRPEEGFVRDVRLEGLAFADVDYRSAGCGARRAGPSPSPRYASLRLATPRYASLRLTSPRLASPRLVSPRLASPPRHAVSPRHLASIAFCVSYEQPSFPASSCVSFVHSGAHV